MITRPAILAHLERGIRTGFLKGQKSYNSMRGVFTREVGSDGAYEDYTDFGDAPWPVANAGKTGAGGTDAETGRIKVGVMDSGRSVRVVGIDERSMKVYNVDWEIVVGLDHNAINDDRTGDLITWATGAGQNFQKHMDYLCFSALNAGDANTYGLCYDGLTLFNNSHVDPGAEYTTAQDNVYGLTLSLDNFKTVKIAAAKFLDGRGVPFGLNHNLLIVPPDLEYEAAQITQNREAYDTANREMNPYAGNVRAMVAPGGWLDTTAWFLMDVSQVVKPINLQMRQAPQLVQWDDETQAAGIRYYKWHARYQVFYGDWRLAVMGNS